MCADGVARAIITPVKCFRRTANPKRMEIS